jgi:hypothetical protein
LTRRQRAGAPSSPWRGSRPRVPGGACPPVKPLTVALRRPWLRATPRRRGSGSLTGLVLWHYASEKAPRRR